MEIKPGNRQGTLRDTALVTFDNLDQWWWFGADTPMYSREYQRWMRYVVHDMWVGPTPPSEFPAEIEVSEKTLAHTAGKMIIEGALRSESPLGGHEARHEVVGKIIEYFSRDIEEVEPNPQLATT